MSDKINIEISANHLLIIFCIFIFITLTYINLIKFYNKDDDNYKYSDNIINKINKNLLKVNRFDSENNISNIPKISNYDDINYDIERHNFLNKRDSSVVNEKLIAPERRLPEYMYPYNYIKKIINIPTRGYPENYHLYGIVTRKNHETVYRLYGRQTFPGSNQYEYYIQGSINDNTMKIPIRIPGDKEIEDDQIIKIPGTNPEKGEFHVKLYKYDVPRYNPYLDVI